MKCGDMFLKFSLCVEPNPRDGERPSFLSVCVVCVYFPAPFIFQSGLDRLCFLLLRTHVVHVRCVYLPYLVPLTLLGSPSALSTVCLGSVFQLSLNILTFRQFSSHLLHLWTKTSGREQPINLFDLYCSQGVVRMPMLKFKFQSLKTERKCVDLKPAALSLI